MEFVDITKSNELDISRVQAFNELSLKEVRTVGGWSGKELGILEDYITSNLCLTLRGKSD